jgi:hypothetical protein
MSVYKFRDKLVSALSSTSIPKKIRTEKDLEMRFFIPVVMQILLKKGIFKYTAILGTTELGVNQIVRLPVNIGKQWSGVHSAGQKARSGHRF